MGLGDELPENVSVRGPGNGTQGYCMLSSTASSGGLQFGATLDDSTGTVTNADRSYAAVPVEVAINPADTDVLSQWGYDVPADSYLVVVYPFAGVPQTLTGALPTVSPGLGFPSAWIDPSTGIPYQLTFGWAGSTGYNDDVHEINDVSVSTLNGAVPQLGTTVTDDASGAPAYGSTMSYHVDVSNQADTADDPGPISISDTLPAGETPLGDDFVQNGWSCSISGQSVACQNAGPLLSGASLPTLVIPVSVTAAGATTLTNTVDASSDASNPASGSDVVTVAQASTSLSATATPTATGYGNTVELDATGLPQDATGSVTFTDAGNATLCSATVSGGAATCDTGVLAPGAVAVTATYSGDGNYLGATDATSFTITTAATALTDTVKDANTHSAWGATETLGATAYAGSSLSGRLAGANPTGSVSYKLYANGGCSGTPVATDTETLSAGTVPDSSVSAPLGGGEHSYEASYSGDSDYAPSDSDCSSFAVAPGAPTVGVAIVDATTALAWAGDETVGTEPFASATVTGIAGFTPTGTVVYRVYDNWSCSGAEAGSVSRTLSGGAVPDSTLVPGLGAGDYSFSADYGGDSNYTGSPSCQGFTIAAASSSTAATVTDATNAQAWGGTEVTGAQAYDVATVTGAEEPAPTGTITYELHSGGSCGGSAISSDEEAPGTASAPTAPLAPGTYSFAASYSGDANYTASSSSCHAFSVAKATPVLADTIEDVATSLPWSGTELTSATAYDDTVVMGATWFVPTGSVTYRLYEGSACAGTPLYTDPQTLVAGLGLSAISAPLAAGTYSFQAAYSGDGDYAPATDACQPFAVQASATAPPASGSNPAANAVPSAPTVTGLPSAPTVPSSALGPSNHFSVSRLRARPAGRGGVVSFQVRLPGGGTLSALATVAGATGAGRASGKATLAVYGSKLVHATGARAMVIEVKPNAGGQRLISRHAGAIAIELAITFTPTGGTPRTLSYRVKVAASP